MTFDADNTPFAAIGGEGPVRALVDAFYDFMDRDPDCAVIRAMHPEDLGESRDKLFGSFSAAGWEGLSSTSRSASAPADAPRAVPDRGGRA